MLVRYGRISVYCFLSTLPSAVILLLPYLSQGVSSKVLSNLGPALSVYFLVVFLAVRLFLKDYAVEVGARAYLLGVLFSSGIFLSTLTASSSSIFGWYMCVMSFFHFSEFVAIAATNPASLSIDSYILNHSTEYKVAAITSWAEFWLERWFCPGLKEWRAISYLGLALCLTGEVIRKLAMFTAKSNFNHIVQSEKQEGHTLVTHGVYALCRHPSYTGWFYWAIGTQLILVNPVCSVAYIAASWKFFYDRITVEEVTLLNFFQYDYIAYQKAVPTGLPFIKGYVIDDL